MSIDNKSTFSGYLVGIGKIRKDGSMDYRELERPVKNMIVKQGLNNFLRYNGSDTALASFSGYNNENYYKLAAYCFWGFQWCAYGDSNSASVFATTTELGHRLVDQYTTMIVNWPYCGSTIFETSKTRHRVTHTSDVAVTAASVKELGYYLKLNDNSYQLFSRVVLPAPFELDAGEQLVTTYELVVEYGDVAEPSAAFQTGLLDANGFSLEAKRKMSFSFLDNNSANSSPYIVASTGLPRCIITTSSCGIFIPPIYTGNDIYRKIRYWTNNHNFPSGVFATENNSGSTMGPYSGSSSPSSITKPYVYDSFRREVELTLPQYWPNLNSPDESLDMYYIQNQGVSIQFGHTVDGVWTPTPWKKTGNKITTMTFCHTVATAESLEWQANQ
ncbi:MAG: hypothetical protein J6U20_03810 [Fibrobacter sp.]|nr:hypothetical protein [Fibrobacter sp.]